jgi:hypothetical protein
VPEAGVGDREGFEGVRVYCWTEKVEPRLHGRERAERDQTGGRDHRREQACVTGLPHHHRHPRR